MSRLHLSFLGTILLCLLGAAATQPASTLRTRAHRILQDMKATVYQHKTDIDETKGQFNCDCSGFIGYLLKQELPRHFRAVPKIKTHSRPTSSDFHDFFISLPDQPKPGDLWQRVDRLADAREGDLLVWRREDPIPKGESTGHIMLIDAPPQKVAPDAWAVVIIDSTSRAHHQDTRKPDETGVGRGTVFVKTDPEGRPVAYSSRAQKGPYGKHAMSIGRTRE